MKIKKRILIFIVCIFLIYIKIKIITIKAYGENTTIYLLKQSKKIVVAAVPILYMLDASLQRSLDF